MVVAEAGSLSWRPLTADDLPSLAGWLAEPGVARWWHHDPTPASVERDFGPSVRGEEPGEDLVVLLDGREHSYFTVDVPRLRRDLGLGGG